MDELEKNQKELLRLAQDFGSEIIESMRKYIHGKSPEEAVAIVFAGLGFVLLATKGVLQPTGYMQIPTMRIDFDGEKVIYDFSEQGKEKESELPTRANAENSLATIGG